MMEKDCEIYVDPEEDEVFFGCVTEKEKSLYAKLESNPNEDKNKTSESLEVNVDEENNKNILINNESGIVHKEILVSDPLALITNNQHDNSVELEHNYSTPVKPKIDKSILTTPKSVVKADKDGGFLKVLSEIALFKAEAENDKDIRKNEDEDKENKIKQEIPEIRVTEATPERIVLSPPRNINKQKCQFRIVYRSPNEDKLDQKSHLDDEKDIKNGLNQALINKTKSINLIDLDETDNNKLNESVEEIDKESRDDTECPLIKLDDTEKTAYESEKDETLTTPHIKSEPKTETPFPKPPLGLRFSKEARKIVEVLKKSTVDDTLNFTITEIDVENEENSFVSPEAGNFDKTEFLSEESEKQLPVENKFLSKTVEKECCKATLVIPENRREPVKHFSETRVYNQVGNRNDIKKCVRKLPLDEKRSASVEKMKGIAPPSKIPLFGLKNAKVPLSDRIPKPSSAKTTSVKTPKTKTVSKNSKFSHIESPINAYIHNKQTALVVNVKPEPKKELLTGIPKLQTLGSAKKLAQTKSQTRSIHAAEKPKFQCSSAIKLPFVEYKSATPYKIEKAPESRLPRLAPSVQKLIGTLSPRVLKHEGRFYLTTPRKTTSTENSTIIADTNEVSVVVCQSAQKSNTIK